MSDRRVDVFFYGLFMDVETLREGGVAPVAPRRACVDDFALRIGRRATLVPAAGGRVYGMLFALTHAEVERLYAAPGLEGYRPEAVLARPLGGPPAPALCYNLRDAPRPDERNPEYAARLQRVLGRLDFPTEYVASITPTSVDSGRRDMEYRTLGRTGLRVSALGFGCGNVGGLMVRGAPAERERAVARAIELGVNYFDTAPSYGDGLSEQHLGQALRSLGADDVLVGTKVRLAPEELQDVRAAVPRALDASLRRLGRERVDLFQLHNLIGPRDAGDTAGADRVIDEVGPALEALKRAGKTRFYGITALGDAGALHRVVEAGVLDTAQVCYNLLNPSAGSPVPPGYPGQDFERLLDRARARGVGVIVIRVLAAGALSGAAARHPVAVPTVEPIGSGPDYATDVARARTLRFLVEDGHAASLVEASLRFPLSSDAVSTVLLGYSSLEHLEQAAAAIGKGPLPPATLARLTAAWHGLAGG